MKTLIGIILAVIVIWGGWYYFSHRNSMNSDTMMNNESSMTEEGTETMKDGDEAMMSTDATVTGGVDVMSETK